MRSIQDSVPGVAWYLLSVALAKESLLLALAVPVFSVTRAAVVNINKKAF